MLFGSLSDEGGYSLLVSAPPRSLSLFPTRRSVEVCLFGIFTKKRISFSFNKRQRAVPQALSKRKERPILVLLRR